jgi:hypothetical protein
VPDPNNPGGNDPAVADLNKVNGDNPGAGDPIDLVNNNPDRPDWIDGGSSGSYGPVVLDLTGKGIKITPLSSSNMFFDLANDGYEQHTAWAGIGNGVLVYDPSGGAVTQANQVGFTLWDPAAKTDMQALEDVFDSNHDGVLDASAASWSSFRILVTNADGTTTLETLAQAGVTSIDLQANAYRQSMPDGSSIDGETSFTRGDGTTGAAAAVSFAASGDYVVQQSVTQNAAGATVVRNSAYTADGELAEQITTTTLADGLDRTTTYDWNGDGVIDQTETDDTVVNSDGSTTEAVTDTDGSVVVPDSTTTTTSADGLVVAIDRDTTGGGYTDSGTVLSGAQLWPAGRVPPAASERRAVAPCHRDVQLRGTGRAGTAGGLRGAAHDDGAVFPRRPRRTVARGTQRGSGEGCYCHARADDDAVRLFGGGVLRGVQQMEGRVAL